MPWDWCPRSSGTPRTRSRRTGLPNEGEECLPPAGSPPAWPPRREGVRDTPRSRPATGEPGSFGLLHAQHALDLPEGLQALELPNGLLERSLAGPVRDQDELGPLAGPLLPHALDRDLVFAEHAGDLCQHAGPVLHVEQEVVRPLHLLHGTDGAIQIARAAEAAP